MATFIDLADIRACPSCGAEVLRVRDSHDEEVVDLDPHVVFDGSSVPHGWKLRDRHWVVHCGSVAPNDHCFRLHTACAPRQKGQRMTQGNPFGQAAPPGASGPPMKDLANRLLLVDVREIKRGVQTNAGESDCVSVDLVCLDTGEEHADAALWGKVLVGQFTPGVKYVGRVTQGQAKAAQSPPWVWEDGSDADRETAVKYLTFKNTATVATQAAPATPAPVAAAAPATEAPAAAASAPPWLTR